MINLPNILATKHDNDLAHSLLQKNLKNLYDLFCTMKADMAGGADDPLFTTKALQCASCTKAVPHMGGFRADHVGWDSMPQRDASKRILKSGMGFAKMFHSSQINLYEKINKPKGQTLPANSNMSHHRNTTPLSRTDSKRAVSNIDIT